MKPFHFSPFYFSNFPVTCSTFSFSSQTVVCLYNVRTLAPRKTCPAKKQKPKSEHMSPRVMLESQIHLNTSCIFNHIIFNYIYIYNIYIYMSAPLSPAVLTDGDWQWRSITIFIYVYTEFYVYMYVYIYTYIYIRSTPRPVTADK